MSDKTLDTFDFSEYSNRAEYEKQTKELIALLRNDKNIHIMCEKNQIPFSCIEQYPWKIKRWYDNTKPCLGCKGLSSCKQKKRGYLNNLRFNGILQDVISPCRFQAVRNKKTAHMQSYTVCDFSERYETISFQDIKTENEDDEYLLTMARVIDLAEKEEGLFLNGSLGSGKTYLAICAANYHAKKGKKVAFISYPAFTQRMAAGVKDNSYQDELYRIRTADFLVIDDIGAESVSEWNRDQILFPVLDYRYEHRLPTWFTSNFDFESLLTHFRFSNKGKDEEVKSMRLLERIKCMTTTETLTGKDRRSAF